jgi:prepilin-type N-terminal cleavage/methylation domain-containing protein
MTRLDEKGLSLIELLTAITIFAIIAVGATALLSATLDSSSYGNKRYALYREGLIIMERLTGHAKRCTFLLVPNAHSTDRDILAVSGFTNDDNDNYFGDTLFPKIDEDPSSGMSDDGKSGIASIDDDGDGFTDEGNTAEDDEDAETNEDWLDGQDNDGDGNVDEDVSADTNKDDTPGIEGMDDDRDGSVDEGQTEDDDEDGQVDEDALNPLIYSWESGNSTLKEKDVNSGQETVLSTRVSAFQTVFEAPDRILIAFTLLGDDGEAVTLSEYVHIENTYQRIGKRVK